MVNGKTLREIIPTIQFTFQFNTNLKPEDLIYMAKVLQLHQLLKDLFQWRMENKRINLASHWEELGSSFQNICLREVSFKDLIGITKGWNYNRKFKILEERKPKSGKSSHNPGYRGEMEQEREYYEPFGLPKSRPTQLSNGLKTLRIQQNSGKESPFFTIPVIFPEKTRIKGQEQDYFQPETDRIRGNDPEAVGHRERSA
ncbi:hypothetical protein O181_057059 [Austropuccinia psidii MF-1]|uniref:Uncharacterized protein n=1 Tax=Austropuccinia psidii MF-1 TaxID=1389203 RepID=A0A9Q3HWA9_9BASI|nr:hypothetical protein [Austropuccinia psidii MF-1]